MEIDAMGTQKEIARKIIHKNADYILQVKGNQQTLISRSGRMKAGSGLEMQQKT